MKTRANLQRIQSLTYVINDDNAELLQDMNSQLQHLYDTVYQQLPNKEGLALRTNNSIRVSTIRRKVQKSRYSLHCSKLKTTKAKKKSGPPGISKRVGIKADRLRKAHQVIKTLYMYTLYVSYAYTHTNIAYTQCTNRMFKTSKQRVNLFIKDNFWPHNLHKP